MTTRLNQRRVKSSDPAYPTLKEQLDARNQGGTGGGYDMPVGGIPRSDMTDDVQDALALAESAYQSPPTGIPFVDLDPSVQASLAKADSAYQKPVGGIVLADLEKTIQDRLTDYTSYYVKPGSGVPEVDMDADVKSALSKARSAYQKPAMGIPMADLTQAVQDLLNKAGTAYQKPLAGIPLSDLAVKVVSDGDLTPFRDHIKDSNIHITDHTKLKNIGLKSHNEIDNAIDQHQRVLEDLIHEITDARDQFTSLGSRIEASLGKNTVFRVDDKFEWDKGTYTNLRSNQDGNISFDYTPETIRVDVYDISVTQALTDANKIGGIYLTDQMSVNKGTDPWQVGTNWTDMIGMRTTFYVYAPQTGEYKFSMLWSGRARMMVAEHLLFDDYTSYAYQNAVPRTGSITLEGGRMYPVVVEGWYYNIGDRVMSLYWQRPNYATAEIIPMANVNTGGYGIGTVGQYESQVIDLKDTAISQWFLHVDMVDWWDEDDVLTEMATSTDGVNFGPWSVVNNNGEIDHITPERFVKVRFTVHKQYNQYTPLLKSFEIRYVSSANNWYFEEIIEARSTYLALKDRFEQIEKYLTDLGNLQMQFNASNIHPEYFIGVRFAAVELNLLWYYYNQAASAANYQLLADGFIDHFKTLDYIDMDKTDVFTFVPSKLTQQSNITQFDTDADWMKFTRDRLDFSNGSLRLAFTRLSSGTAQDTINNEYYWSYTNPHSLIGSSYSKFIAQPFYVRNFTGCIKRVKVRGGDYNGTISVRLLICPAKADGSPDITNPVWMSNAVSNIYTNYIDMDGIYVNVVPGKKYFLVIQGVSMPSGYYNYFYEAYNNTNASIRLRSDNPENKALFAMYTSNTTPSQSSHWSTSPYYLSCRIEELTEYETEGFAEYITDYRKPARFLTAEYDITNTGNGMIEIQYASSPDQVHWSLWTSDIKAVPDNRFLKTRIHLTRATTGYYSPTVDRIRIGFAGLATEVVSKPFRLGHTPTHVLMIANMPTDQHLTFMASRDDGVTWTEIKPQIMSPLIGCRPGVDLRIKVIFNGNYPTEYISGWAVQGIYHRDISGQNIVALQEEYVAENGQKIFTLKDPYPMGQNALEVYVNGIYQSLYRDYLEIDNKTIEFIEPLIGQDATGQGADIVTFRVATGAYDVHDLTVVKRLDNLDNFHKPYMRSHEVEYVYENGKLKQEIFSGIDYYVVEYTYYADGKQKTITTTTDKTITVESFEYNADGTIKKKTQTVSEVAP